MAVVTEIEGASANAKVLCEVDAVLDACTVAGEGIRISPEPTYSSRVRSSVDCALVPGAWWLGMGSACTLRTALHVMIYHSECFVSFRFVFRPGLWVLEQIIPLD